MKSPSSRESLINLQKYVAVAEKERGFDQETALEKCLLLGEEVGELFKAVRRCSGLKVDPRSDSKQVADELADILNFVFAIANRFGVDLGEAYAHKESANNERHWLRE